MLMNSLQETDPEIYNAIMSEVNRIENGVELIPSENFVSRAVMQAMSSVFTNKYSEGYPGHRYYGGQENVDKAIEMVLNSSIIDDCYRIAAEYRDIACKNLHTLPGKEKRQALIDLADYIIRQGK